MHIGIADGSLTAWNPERGAWVAIGGPGDDHPLTFLGEGPEARARAAAQLTTGPETGPPTGLPFSPTSFRGVMVVEEHYTRAARTMVRRFMPKPASWAIAGYEGVTRRTFPALKPAPRFYEVPQFYFGSHTTFVPDGATVRRPAVSSFLDFELELGAIVTRPWDTATDGPPRAEDVIGAFTVINDFSARDVQFLDERRSPFSGVVKAKSFATGMGPVLVTADEILPRWDRVTGRVEVNGELWCEGSTAGAIHSLDDVIAHIAADERLIPGEVISLGTLAGCCGLELDRFLEPGDEVHLELDGVGTLTNRIAA